MNTWISVGAAQERLNVASPAPMSGFAARTLPSIRTADLPPRASAVAISDQVLVFLDVIAVDAPLVERIREGCPGVTVWVTATHTHAGPCVLHRGLGTFSPEATEAVAIAAISAARTALAERRLCRLEWLTPIEPGVAVNRRRGIVAEVAQLKGMRWRDANDAIVGTLLSYPCHPTALGPLNRELSADYPGFLRQSIEDTWGGICIFATGCAGDINTGHKASASFVTASGDEGRTMADAARVGARLADAALAGSWLPVAPGPVRSANAEVTLNQVPLDNVNLETLTQRWILDRAGADPGVQSILDEWIMWAGLPGANHSDTWTGPVAVVAVGDVYLVLLPCEPFLSAARQIDATLPRAITLGYSGDCAGYLPSRDEYPLGGYEVEDAHRYYRQPAPFAPGSLEQVTEAALALALKLVPWNASASPSRTRQQTHN